MKSILKTYGGNYCCSFFTIFLDVEEDPENLITSDVSTIFHEYIHFIQDVSTVYGYMNIYKIAYEITKFYHLNKDNDVKQVIIPFIFTEDDEIIMDNRDLISV